MRIFLAVARTESLSGAGRMLKLDPATIGRRIQRLEEAMDVALFIKTPQGYTLTEGGQRVMEPALRAEQAIIGAEDAVTGPTDSLHGVIRIGAPDGCANFLLPQIVAQISEENPALEIQIVALPRIFNLTRREADIAIAVSAPTAGRLSVKKVTDYKLSLACARPYWRDHGPVNSIGELKDQKIIGYIPDMIFDSELDYLTEIGIGRPTLASNSVAVQMQMIRHGAGIGIAHDFVIASHGRVRRVLPDEVALTRSFYLVRHADDRKVARLNKFSDRLSDLLKSEVQRLEATV